MQDGSGGLGAAGCGELGRGVCGAVGGAMITVMTMLYVLRRAPRLLLGGRLARANEASGGRQGWWRDEAQITGGEGATASSTPTMLCLKTLVARPILAPVAPPA